MTRPFTISQKVLFRHCDPAGIVFFPRYFEMVNDSIETFFDNALGLPFENLLRTGGIPTVAIETNFPAASFHGDILEISVIPIHLGKSSIQFETKATCADEVRFTCKSTLVLTDLSGKPIAWHGKAKQKLINYLGDNNDT